MKNFLKKLKENFLLKTTTSEMILLIVVVALITFKLVSENRAKKIPVGDFGPSPYQTHIQFQEKN